jgi:hypothetical protein
MSFNSSVQQMFVGLASVIAGYVVVKMPDNKITNYPLTGYISIVITLLSLYIGYRLNRRMNYTAKQQQQAAAIVPEAVEAV